MKKITALTLLSVTILFAAGCEPQTRLAAESPDRRTPARRTAPKEPAARDEALDASAGTLDPARVSPLKSSDDPYGAVRKAIEAFDKYVAEMEENKRLRGEIRQLQEQKRTLDAEIAQLQNQRDQALAELDEANEMMRKLNEENKRWKSDVLGFRKQMLDAQEAQLRGINMILKVMGHQSVPGRRQQEASTPPPVLPDGSPSGASSETAATPAKIKDPIDGWLE
jgi:flagellar motility protein MotE (MotC chaperone)